MTGENTQPALSKTDNIECRSESLRNIKRDPDTSAGFQSQGFGNDRVSAAGTDFDIGCYRRH